MYDKVHYNIKNKKFKKRKKIKDLKIEKNNNKVYEDKHLMSSGGKVKDMGNNTCSEANSLLRATKQKELKQSTT